MRKKNGDTSPIFIDLLFLGVCLASFACAVPNLARAAEPEDVKKLRLCGEEALNDLLEPVPFGVEKNSRLDLEASGVVKIDDHYHVVFDNLRLVAKIPLVKTADLDPKCNEKFPGLAKGSWIGSNDSDDSNGFEGVAFDAETRRLVLAVESRAEGIRPEFRPWVEELIEEPSPKGRTAWRFYREQKLSDYPVQSGNKGVEGLAWTDFGDPGPGMAKGRLLALCEGNRCRSDLARSQSDNGRKEGRGLIRTFRRQDGQWIKYGDILLPKNTAGFDDFTGLDAAIDGEGNQSTLKMVVVSQQDSRLWVGRIGLEEWRNTLGKGLDLDLEADRGETYRFPKRKIGKKMAKDLKLNGKDKYRVYCNLEGVAWTDANAIVTVSDRKKKDDPDSCALGQMSIHVFVIPD